MSDRSLILAPDGTPARQHIETREPRANAWSQVYEAANRSDFRGWFYIPSLNPADQFDSWTADALRERNDWLVANVGAVSMLFNRLALAEAGTGIWPRWASGEDDYDDAMTEAYHEANSDPSLFSADGESDCYTATYNIRRCIRRYGDCFGQDLEPATPGGLPEWQLIPGYQCQNFGDEKPGDGWFEGIRRDKRGRALEYKFITGTGTDRRQQVVPASAVKHYHDPFLPGERRGVPALASVAKKLFRREDIGKAIANGTLIRERMGFAIQSQKAGLGSPPIVFPGQGERETKTNTDGSKYTVQKIFGEKASDEIIIPELPAGAELKTVESDRPTGPVTEYLDSLLREAAWDTGYPPEFIFFLAGMGQGTVARLVLSQASECVLRAREFQLVPQFCKRHPKLFAWHLIKTGYFARLGIKVPKNWHRFDLIFPMLASVDITKEGKMFDARVAVGNMSLDTYHAMQGGYAADVDRDNYKAYLRRLKEIKKLRDAAAPFLAPGQSISYTDLHPRSVNTPQDEASGASGASKKKKPGENDDDEEE